jgi:hypothetical protein
LPVTKEKFEHINRFINRIGYVTSKAIASASVCVAHLY